VRFSFTQPASAASIGFAIVSETAGATNAQSVMKQCGAQWQAAKAAGATNGETWPQFLAQYRANMANIKTAGMGGAPSAQPAPAPAAPPPTYGQAPAPAPAPASAAPAQASSRPISSHALIARKRPRRDEIEALVLL